MNSLQTGYHLNLREHYLSLIHRLAARCQHLMDNISDRDQGSRDEYYQNLNSFPKRSTLASRVSLLHDWLATLTAVCVCVCVCVSSHTQGRPVTESCSHRRLGASTDEGVKKRGEGKRNRG